MTIFLDTDGGVPKFGWQTLCAYDLQISLPYRNLPRRLHGPTKVRYFEYFE